MKYLAIFSLALLVAACGENSSAPNLVGSYQTRDGKDTLIFDGKGKVGTTVLGRYSETTYVVEGGSVRYKFPDGLELKAKINDDGSLTSITGTQYVKK